MQGVEWVRWAKEAGIPITAEVSWLHLVETDAILGNYDTAYKVWPPLGTEADREALIEGLTTGVIDAIVTDHTPFTTEEKLVEFDQAPFGAAGWKPRCRRCGRSWSNPGECRRQRSSNVLPSDRLGARPAGTADRCRGAGEFDDPQARSTLDFAARSAGVFGGQSSVRRSARTSGHFGYGGRRNDSI